MLAGLMNHALGVAALLPMLGLAVALVLVGRFRSVSKGRAAAVTDTPSLGFDKAALFFETLYYGAHVVVLALLPLYLWLA